MTLVTQQLWGEYDKAKIAIQRLQEFEPLEGYYLAFSGGKDSVTIKRLADLAGVRYDAHYNLTTVDPPELVRFIRQEHPDVTVHMPALSMWRLILKEGTVPTRQRRYCCKELKEQGGTGRLVLTGVRWAESVRRAHRAMVEPCYTDGTKTFLHAIIDWQDADVWEFIRAYAVPYCSLYDEGWRRLGCLFCPMSDHADRELARWPKYAAGYVRCFDRLLARGRAQGKTFTWANGQDLFDWWTRRRAKDQRHEGQPVLFE